MNCESISAVLLEADASRESTGGIKTKERVSQHGEVFTPGWVVNDMLDQLPFSGERDVWMTSRDEKQKTFLEPACGEGAFLMEILLRKLRRTCELYSDDQNTWEWQAALAVSSIYGVELLEDNSERCIMNLYELFLEHYYEMHFPTKNRDALSAIKFIISRNIMQGDFLTQKQRDGSPIIVSEFNPHIAQDGTKMFLRKDYVLNELVRAKSNQDTIFSLMAEEPGLVMEYAPVPWQQIEITAKANSIEAQTPGSDEDYE